MKTHQDLIGKFKYQIGLFSGVYPQPIFETDWIKNIITNAGRTLLLNRLQGNASSYITHMAVGTGATAAALTDTTLGTETVRKAVTPTVSGTPAWKVTFNAVFTAAEINNTTEVGLLNAASTGTLATRNVHTAISIPLTSTMGVDYIIQLNSGYVGVNWAKTDGRNYVYEIGETNAVKAVIELDTGHGYKKQTSVAAVDGAANSWYADGTKLYVRCSDDADGDTHTILVLSGG